MAGTPKRRRARGTGSVFKTVRRGRTVWVARGPGGRPQFEGRTQAEVVAKLTAARPPGPDATVGAWADRWEASLRVRGATLRSYRASAAHIRRHLGGVRLRDLTPTRVEAFAAALAGSLAPNTVKKVVKELQVMLGGAVRDGVIPRNPVSASRKPRGVRKAIDPFTPAELARVVAACDSPPLWPVALLAATGCRVGEAVALDAEDFDRARATVSITRTLAEDGSVGPPKTANGVRTIGVPPAALPALAAAKGRRAVGPLFATATGARRTRRQVAKAWLVLLRRLGLRPRNPHQLRHSVATAMVAAGESPADIARYLGDVPATIYATYVHPTGKDPSEAMQRILGGKVGNESAG